MLKFREQAVLVERRLAERQGALCSNITCENTVESLYATCKEHDNSVSTNDCNNTNGTESNGSNGLADHLSHENQNGNHTLIDISRSNFSEPSTHRSSPRDLSKEFLSMPIVQNDTVVIDQNSTAETISLAGSGDGENNKTTPVYSSEQEPRLVRSNSYTLDCPSEMFIKHMESKGIDLGSEWSDVSFNTTATTPIDSANGNLANAEGEKDNQPHFSRRSTPERRPILSKCNSAKSHSSSSSSSITHVNDAKLKTLTQNKKNNKTVCKKSEISSREEALRRIYSPEVRNSRPKPRSQQMCIISKPISSPKLPKNSVQSSDVLSKPSKSSVNEYNRLLQMVEERYGRQMNELLRRQQEEQTRLQQEFCQQQQLLSMQISNMMLGTQANVDNVPTESSNDFYSYRDNQMSIESMDQSSVCECDDIEPECM